ncbi:MAG: ROK family transcriptional regulator [Lachnospiraceae bacterium]|nr:ROK family transcriptional regulator [Lachnospiraceae bacterium]
MNLSDIKKSNYKLVYKLIYHNTNISKPELASALKISIPTVTQCVNELIANGLARENGFSAPHVGRKASIISCCERFKVAVGVEIREHYVHLAAIDLYGTIFSQKDQSIEFEHSDYYCAVLGNIINNFIIESSITAASLLGIAFSVHGLVDFQEQKIFFGKILHADGFGIRDLEKYLAFPCSMYHDSEAAAQYDAWCSNITKDLFYIILNPFLGGAVLIGGELHQGTSLASGLVEHMVLIPNGKPCYCGKKGCVNSYCSTNTLLDNDVQDLKTFFEKMRGGDNTLILRWNEYLSNLALTISNCLAFLNIDVMLSGALVSWFTEDDLALLSSMVQANSPEPTRGIPDISISRHYDSAAGAALNYIRQFLKEFD